MSYCVHEQFGWYNLQSLTSIAVVRVFCVLTVKLAISFHRALSIMTFLSYATLGLIAALFALYQIVSRVNAHRTWSKVPTHTFTGTADRQRYMKELKELLRTGYSRYSKAGEVFKIPSPDGNFRIILPRDKLEEIKNASGRTFSWQLQSRQVFQIYHTGVPDRGPWSAKALRVDLNRHLDDLVQEMSAIISAYFDEQLAGQSGQWQSVNILQLFRSCVARITNHAFCGPALTNDPEWVEATMRFTADGFGAAAEIRGYPFYLKPFAAFFLRSVKRVSNDKKMAKRKLGALFHQRMSARKDSEVKAPDDGFQRMLDAAPPNVSLDEFAGTMMRVMMASVHTTAHTAAIALGDLICQPQYVAGLSQEMRESIRGDRIQIRECDQLRHLDSFLKESQRMTPLFLRESSDHTYPSLTIFPRLL